MGKMKRILVVGGSSTDELDRGELRTFYSYIQGVYPEAAYHLSYLDELCYTIAPGVFEVHDARNDVSLADIDIVFLRCMSRSTNTKAYYLSRYCDWAGKSCVSDYSQYVPADKVGQMILFFEQSAPFLHTLYCPVNELLITRAEATYSYPHIMKPILAAHGDSNYLVKSREDAEQIITREPDIDFLAQAFCPNDRDYRLLIVGEEHLLFERKGSADSHLNNTSKGAAARKVTDVLPPTIVTQARALADKLGIMLAGADIMQNMETGEYYFLEVNVQPQLRTGAFLEEKKVLLHKLLDQLPLSVD